MSFGPPIITSNASVEGYLGIDFASESAAEKAYILAAIDYVTSRIAAVLDVDYTAGVQRNFQLVGNDQDFVTFPYPVSTIATLQSFDPLSPSAGFTGYTIGSNFLVDWVDSKTFYWKADIFRKGLIYNFFVNLAASSGAGTGPNPWATGFPKEVTAIANEMVSAMIRNKATVSSISAVGTFPINLNNWQTFQTQSGAHFHIDQIKEWQMWLQRLRPYRRISI